MSARRMTDQQLRALLYHIAQTYLEIERGLRPPAHLKAFLTGDEYRRHRAAPRPDRPRLGPVQMREIGPLHIERQDDDEISASILTRRGQEQWGALMMHLQDRGKGWQVDQLERLEHVVEIETSQDHETPERGLLNRRIRMVDEEHRLIEAAHLAATTRLEDFGDRQTRASLRLEEQADRWARQLMELDQELRTLTRARDLRYGLDPGGDEASPEKRATRQQKMIEEVLGTRPEDPEAGVGWNRAAEEIMAYRDRWGLEGCVEHLGPPSKDPKQEKERRALIQRIRALHTDLSVSRAPEDCDSVTPPRGSSGREPLPRRPQL